MRHLGDSLGIDFGRIRLDMNSFGDGEMEEIKAMQRRVMCASLDHDTFSRVLLDKDTSCHVDSMYKAMASREAAYRSNRPGQEFWSNIRPRPDASGFQMVKARACTALGCLIQGVEDQLRARGVQVAIETRADMNRYDGVTAEFGDGRVVLFLDTSDVQAGGRNDLELMQDSMSPCPDMSYFDTVMRLFHLAQHAVQLHEMKDPDCDAAFRIMRRQFRRCLADPCYYAANYSEFLMDLEADLCAAMAMMDYLAAGFPAIDATEMLRDYFWRKSCMYNLENQVFDFGAKAFETFDMVLVGLTQKMFKMAKWYETEPSHDGWDVVARLSRQE